MSPWAASREMISGFLPCVRQLAFRRPSGGKGHRGGCLYQHVATGTIGDRLDRPHPWPFSDVPREVPCIEPGEEDVVDVEGPEALGGLLQGDGLL